MHSNVSKFLIRITILPNYCFHCVFELSILSVIPPFHYTGGGKGGMKFYENWLVLCTDNIELFELSPASALANK